ncbi:ribonuclease activity regulator RraA [Gemmobacter fulvus]|uniref:ribonuclease activity regulator RraA n=1 Tax=Gemmobacter fulvus TaxID=2840474 RepID=UPI00350E5295
MSALSPQTQAQLRAVSISTLSTVLFKRGFRNRVMQGVGPLSPSAVRMVGPAFTLRFIPAREDLDTMEDYALPTHVQRRAIEECPAEHVLVIDARGDRGAASAGDIMIARLKARGCAGAVTDGGFRDTADIAALGFPAFHSGPATPSSPIRHHPADLNLPIGCGGVAVYPGDIVVSDSDGVIVIPRHLADEVAAEAMAMTEYETFAAEQVAQGRSIFGLFPSTEESRAEFALWKDGPAV